jgi:hypothetical protein
MPRARHKAKGVAHKRGIAGFKSRGDIRGLPFLRVERTGGIEAPGFHYHR